MRLSALLPILFTCALSAQVPQAFEFQGVARDLSGNALPSQSIRLRLGVLAGSSSGTLEYQETHTTVTSPLGLFTVPMGNGTPVSGTFSGITWGSGPHFVKVELDPTGGTNYQFMGTTQLLSVPYALVAGRTPCMTVSLLGDTLHQSNGCYVIFPGLSLANGGCRDVDGDGFYDLVGCSDPADCNDNNANTHPGALEVCDGADNDCDGQVDEGFNLGTDANNCGTCGHVCSFPNASSTCVNGACQMGSCDPGFANCDGNTANGCETDLSISSGDCGACGNACSFPNAVGECVAGVCQLGPCNTGFGNCDGNPANGCETNLLTSPASCGTCGNVCNDGIACTTDVCVNGACGVVIQAGTCLIQGVCYANGTLEPGFPCHVCNSAQNQEGWSNTTAGTVCAPAICSGTSFTPASTCDGAGSCITPAAISCLPYACDNSGCFTTCSSDSQCGPGFYCSGGACVPKKADGVACNGNGTECLSGNCVDGVCCNTVCNGTCVGCAVSGSVGVCTNIPAGTDPANECAGVCNGNGACTQCVVASDCPGVDTECRVRSCVSGVCGFTNIAAGTVLASQTAGDCKIRQCDGAGNVVVVNDNADVPVDGIQCTNDVCTSGVPSNPPAVAGTVCSQNGGTRCDGSGNCVPAPQVSATSPTDAGSVLANVNITVTFSAAMTPATLTAQTAAGPCTGSIQCSLDNFATCIAFSSASPTMSGGNTTATLTPQPKMLVNRPHKIRVTTAAQSALGAPLAAQFTQANGFNTTSPSLSDGSVVISQIYGGGGSTAGMPNADYIELQNRGATAVDLTDWVIKSAAAASSSWSTYGLSGTIPAGKYFLWRTTAAQPTGTALPTPDYTLSGPDLNATAGKLALLSLNSTFITSCPSSANMVDFVGYGTASCSEGTLNAPAPSNTMALFRVASGCADVNINGNDFTTATPAPRNTASSALVCANVANNESGTATEADFCAVTFPASLSVATSTNNTVYGQVFEAGVTSVAGADANVRAQFGYGPATQNPEYQNAWVWSNATFNIQSGNNDEYQATFTAPAAGTYRYAYRFSLDQGVSWTVCDGNTGDGGAGSNSNLTLEFSTLPVLTVTP